MRRKIVLLGLATALLCLCTYAVLVENEQRSLAAQLIRLHIVANSDDPADQAMKLAVRDRLLPEISRITEGCRTQAQALQRLRLHLPRLQRLAAQTLLRYGCEDRVQIRLTNELFPRRDYDTFSLPAGEYRSLRIGIGAAEGHNWWCVAFPALCLPATSEALQEAAALDGLDPTQTALLCEDGADIQLKFRLLDWLSALFS